MANDQFSLSWDNFHMNMTSGMSSFLHSEHLVDVTLAADGRFIKAHKVVLSVCSPYFDELFRSGPCKHPIVFLKDVSYNVLSNLLEFMYKGEVKVSQDDLSVFIKTAESLKIKGLTGDITNFADDESQENNCKDNLTESTDASELITNGLPASTSELTITRRTPRTRTPPRKKMLGPASKRFKMQSESQPSLKRQETDEDSSESVTKPPPLIPFSNIKIEPEDVNTNTVMDKEEESFDSPMNTFINSYSDGPSTSSVEKSIIVESLGPNQGRYKFVVTQLGTLNLVLHHHLYRPRSYIHGTKKRVWICTWRDKHCPARAISENGRLLSKRGMHNHPSQREFIASKEALGLVCYKDVL